MMFDPDPLVRIEVARRLEPHRLGVLVHDADLRVRFTVAERGGADVLHYLKHDRDPEVRSLAVARLSEMTGDADGPGA